MKRVIERPIYPSELKKYSSVDQALLAEFVKVSEALGLSKRDIRANLSMLDKNSRLEKQADEIRRLRQKANR